MRTPWMPLVVTFAAFIARPLVGEAQSLSDLVAAGRFEEAAASLAGAGPAEAEAGATMIFNEAYADGYNRSPPDYVYAMRGIRAARQVPNLSPETREQLDFWYGLSLFQRTVPLAQPQDLEAARASLPGFQEAQAFLNQSGDHASTVGVDLRTTMRALGTFIEIQEAIIRRGY